MDHFELRDGVLHCEDVALPAIAAAVGTPTYVYSAAAMAQQVRAFRAAVSACGPDPLTAFAVKANPNIAVLTTLAKEAPSGPSPARSGTASRLRERIRG